MQGVQQPRDRGERLAGRLGIPGYAGERGELGQEEGGSGVAARDIRRHRREPPVAFAEQFEPDPVGAALVPVGEGDELVAHRPCGGQQLLRLRRGRRTPRPAVRTGPVRRLRGGADHGGPDDPFLVLAVDGVHRAHLRLDARETGESGVGRGRGGRGRGGCGRGGRGRVGRRPRDRTAGTAPQLRGARPGGEHRYVTAPQLRDLLILHAGQRGHTQERGAQQGQHPVPFGGVPHQIGVGRLVQQRRVRPGGAGHDAHLVPGEPPQRPIRGEEFVAVVVNRRVPGAEAVAEGFGVRGGVGGLGAEPGPVGGLGEPPGSPYQPHAVGPGVRPVGGLDGGGGGPAPADGGHVERGGVPDEQLGEQAHPVDGVVQGPGGRIGGTGGPQRRVEQGLHVDQHRVRSAGDQVLVVQIRTVQRVQQGQQRTLAPVEPPGLRRRGAGPLLDELGPAVVPPVQDAQHPQLGGARQRTEPLDKGVEVPVGRERARLVDQPGTVGEPQEHHGPAPAMAVTRTGLDPGECPRTRGGAECSGPVAEHPCRGQQIQVGGEPRDQLGEGVSRVEAGRREEAGQHRVPGDEPVEPVPASGHRDEVPEALLGPVPAQPPEPPGFVQLGDEGARRDPGQPPGQLPPEVGEDGLPVPLGPPVRQRVPEPARGRLDERRDDGPEAAEPRVRAVGDHNVTRGGGDGLPGEGRPGGFAGRAAPDDTGQPPGFAARTVEGNDGDGGGGGGDGGGRATARTSVDQVLLRHAPRTSPAPARPRADRP
ncbi:hypothetical protein A3Q37_05914 [Streptomyces sp. PTY087I2]|nr:hypothetical protein A3Q37_05914 [Streptomyces sp. PTY087I2]